VYNITEVFPCETCGFIVKFKYLLGKCGADLLQAQKGFDLQAFFEKSALLLRMTRKHGGRSA